MGSTLNDMEQLADINDQMRRQLDRSNAIILELNHRLVERDAEIAALRQQVAELENTLSKRAEQQARMWEVFRGMASAYHEIRSNTDLRFNYYMTQLDKLRD